MSRRYGFTLVELLVVIAIIGILAGLLLPAVQQAREASRLLACKNNLRQLGVALHMFHDSHGVFPASGWTQVGPGNPTGRYVGWRAMTLPFLEQSNLHQIYDFESNWWDGTNAVAASVPVPVFRCPSVPNRPDILSAVAKPPRPAVVFANPIAPNDYEAIMGVQPNSINSHLSASSNSNNFLYDASNRFSIMYRNSRARMASVTDGTSQTIAIVECGGRPVVRRGNRDAPQVFNDQGIGWADSEGPFSFDGATRSGDAEGCGPQQGCVRAVNGKNDNEPYSFHISGANMLYVDGHVHFVGDNVDLLSFAAQCTMAAGEIGSAR